MFRAFAESPLGGVIKLILAEAGNFPDVARFFCSNFELRGRELFAKTLRRGVARGEFRPIADIDAAAIIVAQPLAMHSVWLALARALRQAGADQRRILRRLSRSDPQGSTVMTARKRIFIAAIGVAAVLASGAFAWKATRAPASQVAFRPMATARPLELIPQEIHTIKPRGLVDTVRFTGTTQPIDQTVVKARVAGRLAEVLVREGDKVTKGQLLARFETTELQAKVDERQSAVDAARAELRWASRDRSDKETLSARNIVSRSAADQARSTGREQGSMVAGLGGPARGRTQEPRRRRGTCPLRRGRRRAHRQPG